MTNEFPPRRIWVFVDKNDLEGDGEVFFEAEEGGTKYVRADVADEALAALKGMVDAVAMGPLDVAAKYGPDAHPDEAVIDATFRAKDVIAKLEAS